MISEVTATYILFTMIVFFTALIPLSIYAQYKHAEIRKKLKK